MKPHPWGFSYRYICMRKHIPKDELVVGQKYQGHCRNATEAVWDGKYFEYTRYKFGDSYQEKIHCPEDFAGFDVFYAEKPLP